MSINRVLQAFFRNFESNSHSETEKYEQTRILYNLEKPKIKKFVLNRVKNKHKPWEKGKEIPSYFDLTFNFYYELKTGESPDSIIVAPAELQVMFQDINKMKECVHTT